MLDGLFPTDATEVERAPRHAPSVAQPSSPVRRGAGEDGQAVTSGPVPRRSGPLVTPRVIGLDLSLTGTGIVDASTRDETSIRGIVTTKNGATVYTAYARLDRIRRDIIQTILRGPDPAVVVIEGPSYASAGAGTWDRGGLWWLVVAELINQGFPVAIAPPSVVKKYATGKGNASKAAVCSAAGRRYDRVFVTDDEADAFVLAAMGLDHLGHPLAAVPAAQREALAKVAWPEVAA